MPRSIGFLLLGFASLTAQAVLAREAIFAFSGGEIGLGLFFAVWLASIASGAALGARGLRGPRFRHLLPVLPLTALVGLIAARVHRLVLPVAEGGYLTPQEYILFLAVCLAPSGFLTGWLFPSGLRDLRVDAGAAYALEAAGSALGGCFASLFAIARLGPVVTLGISLALAGAWGIPSRGGARARGFLLALLALVLVVFLGPRLENLSVELRWEGLATGTRLLRSLETPYRNVALGSAGGEVSVFLDGRYHGALRDPYVDSTQAALLLAQHPRPSRVLMIAEGCFGPTEVMASANGVSLRLVRPDEALDVAIAQALGGVRACDSSSTADPRAWVEEHAGAHFDMIIVGLGGPATGSLNRFYTKEFFRAAARALAPGGVLALDLAGSANVPSPEKRTLRAGVYATLTSVFDKVLVLPGQRHLFFASLPAPAGSSQALLLDPDSLAARYGRLWPGSPRTPAFFARLVPLERTRALNRAIRRESLSMGGRLNSDLLPFLYYEQLRVWARLAGGGLEGALSWVEAHRTWAFGIALALTVLILLGASLAQGPAIGSIAGTGAVGMGMDIALLLLYQARAGTLYLEVGLLVGLFMLGLAAGSAVGQRVVRLIRPAALCFSVDALWVLVLISGFGWLGPLVHLPVAQAKLAIPVSALAAGFLAAFQFPAAVELASRVRPREAAGAVADAADHAGAIAGAVVIGVFAIPLLGFAKALSFLALIKTANLVGWGLRWRLRQS